MSFGQLHAGYIGGTDLVCSGDTGEAGDTEKLASGQILDTKVTFQVLQDAGSPAGQ